MVIISILFALIAFYVLETIVLTAENHIMVRALFTTSTVAYLILTSLGWYMILRRTLKGEWGRRLLVGLIVSVTATVLCSIFEELLVNGHLDVSNFRLVFDVIQYSLVSALVFSGVVYVMCAIVGAIATHRYQKYTFLPGSAGGKSSKGAPMESTAPTKTTETRECEVCGQEFEADPQRDFYTFRCQKCRAELKRPSYVPPTADIPDANTQPPIDGDQP